MCQQSHLMNVSHKCWVGLLIWLLVTFSAASMGVLFIPGDWYTGLEKPSWNPPAWIFAPVWTMLYTMMGLAAWLVWRRGGFLMQCRPLLLFLIQLVLNAAWTPIFFGLNFLGIAFLEILLLWMAIVATLITFFRARLLAGWLLVPYFLWVSFAVALNFTLWKLNQ